MSDDTSPEAGRAPRATEPSEIETGRATRDGPTDLDLAPLPDMIGYTLRRTQVAFFAHFRRAFAEIDIRPVQLGILTVIRNNPGLKQAEVCVVLGIKRTNLVSLLDGLETRGLIARSRVESDRRSHALHLTPAGETILTEAHRREAALEREVTGLIGEAGRHTLIALLKQTEAACRTGPDALDTDPDIG